MTKKLLDEWNCSHTVSGMVFDTTSANTGAVTAGCISIQIELGRELLWNACRHHVGEVILTHVWDDLKIEVSKSPDFQVFVKFKDCFESLTNSSVEDLELPIIPEDLSVNKQNLILICQEAQAGSFAKGDYKELVDLVLLYLGEGLKSFDGFIRTGALHKARWMAKLLYGIKIVLLRRRISELPKGAVFSAQQSEKLQRFILFTVFCYVPW